MASLFAGASAGGGGGGGGGGGSSSSVFDDLRLNHVGMPDWQRNSRQAVWGSDFLLIEPTSKVTEIPTQVDFELPSKESLFFGPMSKFRIKGTFQMLAENTTKWVNVPAAEAANVLLAPNWFEMLIREVTVFHDNYRIASGNDQRHITPFLNAYLLHNMDPLAKQMLCPQNCHPGHCLPSPSGTWALGQNSWKNYAQQVFTSKAIKFDYTPLFLFPFHQGTNYLIDEGMPRILPAPAMGRITVRFAFTDSQDHIFRKPDTNKAKYRFQFAEFSLVLEEARLSPAFERQLHSSKRTIGYPGVTRLQLVEQVPDESPSRKTKFQDILLPEALFIFCLDKKVANGTFKFSDDTSETVFKPHNLKSVDLSFDGKRFSLREPNLGTFHEDELDTKQMYDHLATPPFGIRQDPKHITQANLANGWAITPFPHVYVSLLNGPDRQRLIPSQDDGSCVHKKADLEIDLKFTETNSPKDAIFVITAIYTDVNVVYDGKNRHFFSPYLKYMN
jgi:hypothetical protein